MSDYVKRIVLVLFIFAVLLTPDFAVWIGQELVIMESVADRVRLDPLLFIAQLGEIVVSYRIACTIAFLTLFLLFW